MPTSSRSTVPALIVFVFLFLAGSRLSHANDATTDRPDRGPVQVADRRLRELPERPRPSRSPERKATTSEVPEQESPAPASSDPYGFAAILNAYRASAGLPPLAYDADLSNWAAHNNAVQASRGLGHHVLPNCYQNCGWNYADAWSVAQSWMNSPGHRSNMLTPSATRFGIAYGPGPYWTLNAR